MTTAASWARTPGCGTSGRHRTGGGTSCARTRCSTSRTWLSLDGITGLSVQEILRSTLDGSLQSQQMLNSLYKNGFTAKAAVQYTGDLNSEAEQNFLRGLEAYATGQMDATKSFIPVPLGSKIEPLNIKLTDSQFIELRKHSALQIAAAFGVKPNQVNDYEKSSFANSEAQQLAFLTDTLLWILKGYEEELSWEAAGACADGPGEAAQFNTAVMLRADTKTQIESMVQAVANSVYMPNEARAYLGMSSAAGGDRLIANGNVIIPWRTWGSSMEMERSDGIMDAIQKAARVEKQALAGKSWPSLINRQALEGADGGGGLCVPGGRLRQPGGPGSGAVYRGGPGPVGRAVCGKTVIMDHRWSASGQTARIYAGAVEESEGVRRLVLRAYMLRNDQTAPLIAAIEGGILREVSVGCQVAKAICSICGTDRRETYCGHCPGQEYEGKRCHIDLDDPTDAYELSFVAVPAQKGAGVIKHYGERASRTTFPGRGGGPGPDAPDAVDGSQPCADGNGGMTDEQENEGNPEGDAGQICPGPEGPGRGAAARTRPS